MNTITTIQTMLTQKRRIARLWIWLLTLILVAGALSGCGEKPLLTDVVFEPEVITPNADGETDLARVAFMLNQNATVSITLEDNADGRTYTFRPPTRLGSNEDPYTVYFGGVVEGYRRPDDPDDEFKIIKRMLPDGAYTWRIRAEAEGARRVPSEGIKNTGPNSEEQNEMVVSGALTIQDADTQLPAIRGFSVSPKKFSPNQDGIDDRVTINLVLEKDVEDLNVYLEDEEGADHHIAEQERVTELKAKGWHTFDYDGGIDMGSEPPPDGAYTVFAEASDEMGQRVITSDTLEIVNAGRPMAYIVNGEVEFSETTTVLSDTICYTLTVENDSNTHIRTTGPWPGTTYRTDQNFNTLGWSEESGVFRVGMDFDTSLRNYPFRWGIGQPGVDLVEIDGYWYLPPRARSLVTGCIQIVETPVRNPLYYWTGLIHEDVEIAAVNNRVDPHYITIWEP